MARILENFRSGTLGAALTTGSTTIDFGSNPGFATVASPDIVAIVIDPDGAGEGPEIVHLTAYTAGNTTGTIIRGQEGTSDPGTAHPVDTPWGHFVTKADLPQPYRFAIGDQAGNHTTSSATMADVDAQYSLAVPAVVGDVLKMEFSGCFWISSNSQFLQMLFNIGGTDLTEGNITFSPPTANKEQPFIMRYFRIVVSGDISGGTVTVKPRWNVTGGATATLANGTANDRTPVMSVENLGAQR